MNAPETVKTRSLTLTEAARVVSEHLGRPIPANTLWGWATRGVLPARKFAGRWYVESESLKAFLAGSNPTA